MNVTEVNEVLMGVLREMCEAKQTDHIHLGDGSKSHIRNEFPLVDCGKNKSSKFDVLRNRAKKSLTNSFESLIRGRTKKGDQKYNGRRWTLTNQNGVAVIEDNQEEVTLGRRWTITSDTSISAEEEADKVAVSSDVSDSSTPKSCEESTPEAANQLGRPRSFTAPPGGCDKEPLSSSNNNKSQKSSKSVVSGFFRMESYLRSNSVIAGGRRGVEEEDPEPPVAPPPDQTPPVGGVGSGKKPPPTHRPKSWRLEILNRVVTPGSRGSPLMVRQSTSSPVRLVPEVDVTPPKMTSREMRELWRKAILEVLLLIKMERENKTLKVRQTEAQLKRLKLDYEEITPCLQPVADVWDDILRSPEGTKIDMDVILDAVRDGVPRNRRGDIWWLLMEQHKLHRRKGQRPLDELTVQYRDLLKQLTTYQHAILIDLGRTFPSHPYFARQLGAGQLSLFNLLKAYSLLDQQVGYCQGLSFVAGILLMHMPEEQSFEALRYILFGLGFRQQYESDMVSMQIQLYQLSRLLHDHHPDLYCHLEAHEIAPVHYSAAWFLTMFASEFPLAFVSRVFDLIFVQGIEVIFKVALVLLDIHKDQILQCDSIESIMTFLKCTLPNMGVIRMEQVFNQVFGLDISSVLQAYEVEYHVLQEEMSSPRSYSAEDQQLQAANDALRQQNAKLSELLQHSKSHTTNLEELLWSSKSHSESLEQELLVLRAQVDSLQHERAALLRTVEQLHELHPDGTAVVAGHVTTLRPIMREVLDMQVFGNIATEQTNSTPTDSDDVVMAADNNKVTSQGEGQPVML